MGLNHSWGVQVLIIREAEGNNPKHSAEFEIPLLGIYPEKMKTLIRKDTCTTMFTAAKTWKQPKCPLTDEWIKKMWYIYTTEYYSAIKKNEIMPFAATRMDLEGMMLSEMSDRERQISYDITNMWNLNKRYK